MMNYSEATSLLSSLKNFGIKLGLERIRELLAYLGHPEEQLKIIHVAGTNGKGSVAAMTASILQASGFRVGRFTSPHLADWRERLAVLEGKDLSFISRREFCSGIERLKPPINQLQKEKNSPTVFEVLTALALYYFAGKEMDFAIMEVGLGGRLDATNVVKPLVSVITNVALDHQEYLGDTKEKIAREKAGIIKKGGIVVSAETVPAVSKIIEERCKAKSARLIRIGQDVKILSCQLQVLREKFAVSFTVKGLKGLYSNLELSLAGEHQALNAATAIGAVESLSFSGIKIPPQAIRKGLKSVYWPARLEVISKKPVVLIDGAHNPAAAEAVAKTLKQLKQMNGYRELFLIIGCLKDKDIDGMLKVFLPLSSRIIATKPANSRVLDPGIIAQKVRNYGRKCLIKREINEALNYVSGEARVEDLVLITGSLYLAGEINPGLGKKI